MFYNFNQNKNGIHPELQNSAVISDELSSKSSHNNKSIHPCSHLITLRNNNYKNRVKCCENIPIYSIFEEFMPISMDSLASDTASGTPNSHIVHSLCQTNLAAPTPRSV